MSPRIYHPLRAVREKPKEYILWCYQHIWPKWYFFLQQSEKCGWDLWKTSRGQKWSNHCHNITRCYCLSQACSQSNDGLPCGYNDMWSLNRLMQKTEESSYLLLNHTSEIFRGGATAPSIVATSVTCADQQRNDFLSTGTLHPGQSHWQLLTLLSFNPHQDSTVSLSISTHCADIFRGSYSSDGSLMYKLHLLCGVIFDL